MDANQTRHMDTSREAGRGQQSGAPPTSDSFHSAARAASCDSTKPRTTCAPHVQASHVVNAGFKAEGEGEGRGTSSKSRRAVAGRPNDKTDSGHVHPGASTRTSSEALWTLRDQRACGNGGTLGHRGRAATPHLPTLPGDADAPSAIAGLPPSRSCTDERHTPSNAR